MSGIEFDDKEKVFKQEELVPPELGPFSDQIENNNGNLNLYDGNFQSPDFVHGTSGQGWRLSSDGSIEANNGNFRGDITGATGTFSGTVNINSLNIPDSTTANSAHIDSSGNTWWGANVATGISGANAAVTSAGAATFKNILIGGATIQYQVTNAGIFSFGDGSDGAATLDGATTPSGMSRSGSDYTMTRDVYYTDMTMSTATTLDPAGYRIFGTGTLTLNGTAVIKRNGNNATTNGNNGGNDGAGGGTGGLGGGALADGYLKGALAGQNGGGGGTGGGLGAGSPGTAGGGGGSTSNSIGSNGSNGQAGGGGGSGQSGGGGAGGGAGGGGTATQSNVKLIANWHLATLLDISSSGSTVKFDNSGGTGGSGGGGGGGGTNTPAGNNGGSGGGGGGSGGCGGIVAIYFRNIVIGASASITANGGNGTNGGNGGNGGTSANTGGGGGGSGGNGGNGGQVIVVYNLLTNSGTIAAAGGTGGSAGTGGAKNGTGTAGSNGTAGATGTAGTVRQFQISL